MDISLGFKADAALATLRTYKDKPSDHAVRAMKRDAKQMLLAIITRMQTKSPLAKELIPVLGWAVPKFSTKPTGEKY